MASGKEVRYGCSECAKALRAAEDLAVKYFATITELRGRNEELEKSLLTLSEAYDRLWDQHGIPPEKSISEELAPASEVGAKAQDVDREPEHRSVRSSSTGALSAAGWVLHGHRPNRDNRESDAAGPILRPRKRRPSVR